MKNRIIALVAAVCTVFAIGTTMASSANAFQAEKDKQRTEGCDQRVRVGEKSANPIIDSPAPYPEGVDRHNLVFEVFVNYEFCQRTGYSFSHIFSIDLKVQNHTHNGACHGIQAFVMNPNQIGHTPEPWNPTTVEWPCEGGTEVYTKHKNAPDNLKVSGDDPANERCMGADLKVRINNSGDWDSYTDTSACVIYPTS